MTDQITDLTEAVMPGPRGPKTKITVGSTTFSEVAQEAGVSWSTDSKGDVTLNFTFPKLQQDIQNDVIDIGHGIYHILRDNATTVIDHDHYADKDYVVDSLTTDAGLTLTGNIYTVQSNEDGTKYLKKEPNESGAIIKCLLLARPGEQYQIPNSSYALEFDADMQPLRLTMIQDGEYTVSADACYFTVEKYLAEDKHLYVKAKKLKPYSVFRELRNKRLNYNYLDSSLIKPDPYRADYEIFAAYIPVDEGDELWNKNEDADYAKYRFLDEDKALVEEIDNDKGSPVTAPAGAKYLTLEIFTGSGASLLKNVGTLSIGKLSPETAIPTILLDFDEPPTDDDDLRFKVLDEYGYTATTPIEYSAGGGMEDNINRIVDHGWSTSVYRSMPDEYHDNMASTDPAWQTKFDTYVREAVEAAGKSGDYTWIQWSCTKNQCDSLLVNSLKKYGVCFVRGADPDWHVVDFCRDNGYFVQIYPNEVPRKDPSSLITKINDLVYGRLTSNVMNIFTHKLVTTTDELSTANDPYQIHCWEQSYRQVLAHIEDLRKQGKLRVSNSSRWMAENKPSYAYQRLERGLNLMHRNNSL